MWKFWENIKGNKMIYGREQRICLAEDVFKEEKSEKNNGINSSKFNVDYVSV